jgi:hypothetical protein
LLRQVITGGMLSMTVMKLVQCEALPQQSVACQMTVIRSVQGPKVFVTALDIEMMMLLQQLSVAVGTLNVQEVPHCTVWFGPQVMTGGTVSTMVTVWLHEMELLQQSVACQVRVTLDGHTAAVLVMVLRTIIVTFDPQHASTAVGGSNVHGVLHWTVLSGTQVSTGG